MATVDEFLSAPSEELLDRCSRDQLIKIADHFQMDVGVKRLKENVRTILRDNLVEIGIIYTKVNAVSPESGATAQSVSEAVLLLNSVKSCYCYSGM